MHFSLSTTKYEIFPKLESQKLAISEGHLKSELAKTFTSIKLNWYPDWNFLFLCHLKVWEHFSPSSSCPQPVGAETMFKFSKFHTFQIRNRESKIVFKFSKVDTFMRRNRESNTSIYIFLCCAVSEKANEALHGNNV